MIIESDSESNRSYLQEQSIELQNIDTFAQLLLFYLKKKGKLQSEIAKYAHLSTGAVSNYIGGGRLPADLGIVYQIGKALGSSAEEQAYLVIAWITDRNCRDLAKYIDTVVECGTERELEETQTMVIEMLNINKGNNKLLNDTAVI